jgi:hypothetical protein
MAKLIKNKSELVAEGKCFPLTSEEKKLVFCSECKSFTNENQYHQCRNVEAYVNTPTPIKLEVSDRCIEINLNNDCKQFEKIEVSDGEVEGSIKF